MLMCNRLALGGARGARDAGPGRGRRPTTAALSLGDRGLSPGRERAQSGPAAVAALPALEYAAKRGVLGAQLKLARAYAAGRDVPKDDAKAFVYFEQIADQQADISPSSPIAKYAAEAFVALGQYYLDGIPAMPLVANPVYAADLFRHAASYFGNAEAQYRLARLYMNGTASRRISASPSTGWPSPPRSSTPPRKRRSARSCGAARKSAQRRARGLA